MQKQQATPNPCIPNTDYIPLARVGSHFGSHVGSRVGSHVVTHVGFIVTCVGSARLFGYAKWLCWGSKPPRQPSGSGFALQ